MADELCHCGRPLHYTDPTVRTQVERMIALTGSPTIEIVHANGRRYRVPKHYIALHGLKSTEVPYLGFPEL